ncbi:hypothetical protein SAMN06265360_107222 [Haloechinothrix alba]|uniref:DUF6545 domain-containing protein n=1 Tax=Haloechinothrix alba TaxID=664784 RepID=A0A238WWP7_9PSEU|nr:MAB_1171c family putative transporter [Haloechinothrix alba]SNR50019.1 hypothetical protein SAMN06265360_107222 [Haloechinothrix alba]
MTAGLYALCVGVTAGALLYRMRALRTDRSPAQVALTGVFFFALCIWVVVLPGLWRFLSETVGMANLSGLLAHIAVMLVTACQQIVLLHLRHDRDVAWRKAAPRLVAIGLVIGTMAGLFARAIDRLGEHPTDFAVTAAASNPAYLTVYLTAFGAGQAEVARLCRRYRAVAPTAWLRRSLGLIVVSIGLLWIYVLGRLAGVLAGFIGATGHAWEPVTLVAVVAGSTLHLFGWLLPDLGPQLSRLWAWLDRPRAYRALLPLHSALTRHVPSVVLRDSVAIARDRRADLPLRLYRLIIEIRDAQWALREWMSTDVRRAAERDAGDRGLTGEERDAAIEAAMLDSALHAKAHGLRPEHPVDTPRVGEPADLAAELAHHRALARHFGRLHAAPAEPTGEPARTAGEAAGG